MYGVYCDIEGSARSVLACEYRELEDAQAAAENIREKVRLAKALADQGDAYLRKCTHVFLKDDEGDTRMEYPIDETGSEETE